MAVDGKSRCGLAFLVLGGLALSSCNQRMPDPGSAAVDEASERAAQNADYPHTKEFKSTAQHGRMFRSQAASCRTCHGEDLRGGNAGVSCTQCHQAYPHSEPFKTTPAHGEAFLANRASCTGCHSVKRRAQDGDGGGFCQKCHEYPHGARWHDPKNHGLAFLRVKDGSPDCAKCHDEKSRFKENHPENFVSCGGCHLPLPHSQDFKDGDHADAVGKEYSNCVSCHGDYRGNMPNVGKDGCFTCHDDAIRLEMGWRKKPTPTPRPKPTATPTVTPTPLPSPTPAS